VEILAGRFKQIALICGLGAAAMLAGCASNSNPGGTGGTSATGGSTSSGGATAAAGSSATGGASVTGGTRATGGATGSGDASAGPTTLFDFATGDQGWVFNTYQATGDGGIVSPYNLAAPGVLPAGDTDGGVPAPTIAADSTVGDPPGSLKVVVTFNGYNQQVNPNFNWGLNALQDWTNKVVSVRVKVDPAAPVTFSGGIMLYAQDTTWAGQYHWADLPTDDNEWYTYTLDMTGTTSVNPAQIIQFTVQIASAVMPTATDDAGVPEFTPATVTAYIDTITVQ
jgi:hypothetical protein